MDGASWFWVSNRNPKALVAMGVFGGNPQRAAAAFFEAYPEEVSAFVHFDTSIQGPDGRWSVVGSHVYYHRHLGAP